MWTALNQVTRKKATLVWTIEEQMEMLRGIIFVVHCRVIPASVMFLKTEQ